MPRSQKVEKQQNALKSMRNSNTFLYASPEL